MRVAIVYNRESKRVINLFGVPNQEKYGLAAIKRITNALKAGGHQVIAVEGDKDLVSRLEDFMPRVLKGERPGLVFNLSYGIQGQARYTHVPGILEMVGIPYVGSGPLAHSLALDKAVTKMLFEQHGLPTPRWVVIDTPDFEVPDIPFPMITKPKGEGAVSMGIRIVKNEAELRDAAENILGTLHQPVLVEEFIAGREINVGVLGNGENVQVFPPAELVFGEGEQIYTEADKRRKSGREVAVACPAELDEATTQKAQELSRRAFLALGCADCARLDMRMNDANELYLLEINTLPSLGEHGSYVQGAAAVGMDFAGLVNRLVEVASARYFGTPSPRPIAGSGSDADTQLLSSISGSREPMEKRLREWVSLGSRTNDPVGLRNAVQQLDSRLHDVGLRRNQEFTDERAVWAWETEAGARGGALLAVHLDVPVDMDAAGHGFRRGPEWVSGEGMGCSRAPLVMLEFALRAVRQKRLRKLPLGVVAYTDEGRDCRYSGGILRAAMGAASQVLVLRPASSPGQIVHQRRGQKKYRWRVEGKPVRAGQPGKHTEVMPWIAGRIQDLCALSSRKARVAVSIVDLKTEAFPMLLPHRITATVTISYPDETTAERTEAQVREKIGKAPGIRWELDLISDRPPLVKRPPGTKLAERVVEVGKRSDIELEPEGSVWPSVAGLAPRDVPVVCGLAPVARDLYQPEEAVQRLSLVQRTLVLAQLLADGIPK